jgi:HSP20 family protein
MTQYNPMRDLTRAGGLPSIEDFFREFAMAPALRGLDQPARMKVDIDENDQAYIMKAEVPGANKEDIQISIDGNQVSVRAKVEEEMKADNSNTIRSERVYGEEFRTFVLPQEVDDAKAEARYENGILTLTLPKKSGRGGRKLTVQ